MKARLVHLAVRVPSAVSDERVAAFVDHLIRGYATVALHAEKDSIRTRCVTIDDKEDAFFRKHTFAETGVEG